MRKADLKKNVQKFETILNSHIDFLDRVMPELTLKSDKEEIVESSILRLCSYWEGFIDDMLIDSVNNDSSRLAEFVGVDIPKHLDLNICEAILFSGGYKDFRSVQDIKTFSSKVIPKQNNPFRKIGKNEEKKIDEAFKLRNYIIHRSRLARRALFKIYSLEYKIKVFVKPGRFLLARYRATYKYDRLVDYFVSFIKASQDMMK